MNTVSQYPELMSAMREYNDEHSYEKVIHKAPGSNPVTAFLFFYLKNRFKTLDLYLLYGAHPRLQFFAMARTLDFYLMYGAHHKL